MKEIENYERSGFINTLTACRVSSISIKRSSATTTSATFFTNFVQWGNVCYNDSRTDCIGKYVCPIDQMTQDSLSRISIRPDVCFGKPCIRGHRIWVSLILDRLAAGETIDELLQDYPGIETADILACIAYGAEMSRNSFIDLPLEIHEQREFALT